MHSCVTMTEHCTAMMSADTPCFQFVVFLPHRICVLLLYWGGGGQAEATLSDVQLSRITGADILCQLWHTGRLPAMASAGIKSKTQRVCVSVCVGTIYIARVFWQQQFVCFQLALLSLCWNLRLDVGATLALYLLGRPIRKQPLWVRLIGSTEANSQGIWLWLNNTPLFTWFIFFYLLSEHFC